MGSSSPFCIRCAAIVLFWPLCRPRAQGLARTGQESAQAKSLAEGPVQALNPAEKPQGLGVFCDLFPHPRHIGPLFSSRQKLQNCPHQSGLHSAPGSCPPLLVHSFPGTSLHPSQPLLGTAH